jgi:hypothetical protein
MKACLEKAKEPTSVEMKSVAVHKEVPEEDAAVETGRPLKNRHRGKHLAAGCRRKPKEQTQSNGGCREKLAPTHRGMTCHAGVAQHKGYGCQGHRRDNVAPRTKKERTDDKRYWKGPECKNGIRNRGLKQQLYLGNMRAFNKIYRKTLGLEIMKRAIEISSRLQKVRDRTLKRGEPPPKWKK